MTTQKQEELPTEYEKAQNQLDKILKQFKNGEIEKTASKALIKPKNGDERPIDDWSFRNTLMTMITGTTDARGYNQWKEVGRQVKKGATSIRILAPQTYTKEVENNEEIERLENEPWATKKKENKNAARFEIMNGYRAVPVFRYEDTEPIEDHEEETYKKEEIDYTPNQEELPELMPLAQKMGLNIEYEADRGLGAAGSYGDNTIKMRTKHSQTFYHELAHHAEKQLRNGLKKGQDPKQEASAELAAAVLAQIYEPEEANQSYTFNYLESYSKKEKDTEGAYDLALKVLGRVDKILQYIIKEAEKADFQEDKEVMEITH